MDENGLGFTDLMIHLARLGKKERKDLGPPMREVVSIEEIADTAYDCITELMNRKPVEGLPNGQFAK